MTLWHALTLVLLASVVGFAVLLIAVMRQVGSILMVVGTSTPLSIPAGPKIGSVLPLPGSELKRPLLVVFVSPECTQCRNLLPGFGRLGAAYDDQLQLVAVVSHADEGERRRYAREVGPFARVDLPHLYDEWNVPGTPFAVALDSERRVRGSAIVNTLDQLETVAVTALAVAPIPGAQGVDGAAENGDGAHARTGGNEEIREEVVT
jgi:thiol-disulfide isomerase/thioredoxin